MFDIGAFVVYGNTGICKIEDITTIDMPGADNNRLYYIMTSVRKNGNRVFVPVDSMKIILRAVMDKNSAISFLDTLVEIDEITADNDKVREELYKEYYKSCDCKSWVSIIKTISSRNKERISQGKKITATDERYYRMASEQLFGELAFAMELEPSEVEKLVNDRMEI